MAFERLDLSRAPMVFRQGFEAAWTGQVEFNDPWQRIPSAEKKGYPIQVRMLDLQGIPDRMPFSLKKYPTAEFSFAVDFTIPEKEAEKPGSLGLFLGSIGVNWEIFLNGHSISRQIYLNDENRIVHERSLSNISIEMDKQFIRPGKNVLFFRIIGDPADPETGFYTGFPFFIDRYDVVFKKTLNPFTRILISLYLLIGIYFLYLYRKSRSDLSHLFFGLFCVAYFSYKLAMDYGVIELFSHTGTTHRIEFISLFCLIPMILGFFDTILTRKISRFSKGYGGFALVLICFCFFAPHAFLHDLLRVFQLSIPVAYFHILIYFYRNWYGEISAGDRFSALFRRLEGRLFMGITICFIIGMVDVFRSMFYITTYQLSQYVFFLLSFPMGLAIVQQFTETQRSLINSQRLIAQSRQQAIDNLKRADRLKDEFLAATSHELKTPIHGIIGITQTALEKHAGKSDSPLAKSLRTTLASAKRLAILIDDILDYSRLKNQDLKLSVKPVDLHSVSTVLITLFKPLADKKQIQIINNIPATGAYVTADENRIYQILQNLINNALKFTPLGRIELYVSAADGFIETHVKDTGIGIDPKQQTAIFKSFTQLEDSENRQYEGIGLGLSITRHLVEQHGGTIRVDSSPGKGADFAFTLPAADEIPESEKQQETLATLIRGTDFAPDNTIEPEAKPRDKESRTPLPVEQKTDQPAVLVVDDDPVNLQIVTEYLGETHHVITVSSGQKCLAYLEENPLPDLVLLDIMMPGLSGFDVCRKIRESFGSDKLPVIFLSAKNQVSDLTQGFTLGANDYLSKPFSRSELLTRVGYHIDFNSKVRTAGKRIGALKDFCKELKNFKTRENLVRAIHTLLFEQLGVDGSVVVHLPDRQIFDRSGHSTDPDFIQSQIREVPIHEEPVIHPFDTPEGSEQGWVMKLRISHLEEYAFLFFKNSTTGGFSDDDLEFAGAVIRETLAVKNNIRVLIRDEQVLQKYLDLNSRLDDIYFIQADRQFCRILFEGERTLTDYDWSLGDIETFFDETRLLRVHRSFMINPQKGIRAAKEKGGRDYFLEFTLPYINDIIKNLDDFPGIRLSRAKEKICKTNYPGWFE